MKRIIFTRSWATAGFTAVAISAGTALTILPAQAQYNTSTGATQSRSSTSSSGGSISDTDRSFIREAAEGGMAEVRMGELGQQKASSSEVRALAKRLQDDHQKANDELNSLAQNKGIELPSSMGATQQSAISDLESKQGADFDRQFVQHTIKDHQKDISAFEQASRNASDPELKAWAEKTLPVLKDHLQVAERARDSIGKGGTSGSMER